MLRLPAVREEPFLRVAWAVGAGVCLALALPGVGLVPLVLLVPGLLRRALQGVAGVRAARIGWIAGFSQWAVAVPWVVIVLHRYGHAPLLLAIGGWLAMAGMLGTTWALAAWVACSGRASWLPWALPLALAAVEVLQGLPPWHFPWNPVAAVATGWPWLLLPVATVGSAGLSLLLLAVGGALDALFAPGLRRLGALQLATVAVAAVVAAAAAPPFRPAGGAVQVAALQPNVPLEERWESGNREAIEGRVWDLSHAAVRGGSRWVVWPESAVPRIVERDGALHRRLEEFARLQQVWLTVGSIGLGRWSEAAYFNSVYTVTPAGLAPWRYDKIHLVPFGEYVPLLGRLAVLRPLVREVGGFTPGRNPLPVPGPVGPVGMEVCYEVAFPQLAAEQVRLGARVLATITNDGWYGDSAAPRQHLALAQLRAAETRRYLVRAANTGISALIDPRGRPLERLGVGRLGMVSGVVEGGEGITPAVAYGGTVRVALVVLGLGGILVGAWVCRRWRPVTGAAMGAQGRSHA